MGFQMLDMDLLDVNYFLFQLVSMNCEIVLTYEFLHVVNVLLFISVKVSQS